MLAPFLFSIALDYALNEANKNTFMFTTHFQGTYMTDIDFADDFSNTLERAQIFLV